MARSKKISLGFRVVNIQTREALSPIFAKRAPAREIAARLYREHGTLTGVEQITEYVDAAVYAEAQKAKKLERAHRMKGKHSCRGCS